KMAEPIRHCCGILAMKKFELLQITRSISGLVADNKHSSFFSGNSMGRFSIKKMGIAFGFAVPTGQQIDIIIIGRYFIHPSHKDIFSRVFGYQHTGVEQGIFESQSLVYMGSVITAVLGKQALQARNGVGG